MTRYTGPTFHCPTCDTVDDVEHTGRQANRLTTADRIALAERMRETIAAAAHAMPARRYSPSWSDVDVWQRTMHHAIGCTEHDLRTCELDEIREMATRTIGHTYSTTGAITAP